MSPSSSPPAAGAAAARLRTAGASPMPELPAAAPPGPLLLLLNQLLAGLSRGGGRGWLLVLPLAPLLLHRALLVLRALGRLLRDIRRDEEAAKEITWQVGALKGYFLDHGNADPSRVRGARGRGPLRRRQLRHRRALSALPCGHLLPSRARRQPRQAWRVGREGRGRVPRPAGSRLLPSGGWSRGHRRAGHRRGRGGRGKPVPLAPAGRKVAHSLPARVLGRQLLR